MSKSTLLLSSLLLALIATPAPARDWQADPAQSTLTFKGTYQNEGFDGKFKQFAAAISYDEADLANAKFDVKIDVASVDTASSERDDSLKGDEFFDPKKYPQAHFVTASFAKAADGSIEAKGMLTIRDQTKPVTLKVKFAASGDKATLDVDTMLKRADFGLGTGKDWADIGADVPVHGHLVLTGK
jgi:polyisoprenoid-binding protein YceI